MDYFATWMWISAWAFQPIWIGAAIWGVIAFRRATEPDGPSYFNHDTWKPR
jgi:hypothetical protein